MSLNASLNILTLGKFGKKIIIISIYVNNFLFAFNSLKNLAWLQNTISNKYNIKNLKELIR